MSNRAHKCFWTAEEQAILRKVYPKHGAAVASKRLGRSVLAVRKHALLLGLFREPPARGGKRGRGRPPGKEGPLRQLPAAQWSGDIRIPSEPPVWWASFQSEIDAKIGLKAPS